MAQERESTAVMYARADSEPPVGRCTHAEHHMHIESLKATTVLHSVLNRRYDECSPWHVKTKVADTSTLNCSKQPWAPTF